MTCEIGVCVCWGWGGGGERQTDGHTSHKEKRQKHTEREERMRKTGGGEEGQINSDRQTKKQKNAKKLQRKKLTLHASLPNIHKPNQPFRENKFPSTNLLL